MTIPMMIYVGLNILALGAALATHGGERTPVNFWMSLLSVIITFSLLYWDHKLIK